MGVSPEWMPTSIQGREEVPRGFHSLVRPLFVSREVYQLIVWGALIHLLAFRIECGAVAVPARVSVDSTRGAE